MYWVRHELLVIHSEARSRIREENSWEQNHRTKIENEKIGGDKQGEVSMKKEERYFLALKSY